MKKILLKKGTLRITIRPTRKPFQTNQSQRRKFKPRLAKALFNKIEKLEHELEEGLEQLLGENDTFHPTPITLPPDLHNFITNTKTTQQFFGGFSTLVSPTLLCVTHDKPINFYQKAIFATETTYYSILNHSIN